MLKFSFVHESNFKDESFFAETSKESNLMDVQQNKM